MERSYIAIDLKSFYASVECVERGLDPLDTNLVVADPTRTEKTICLAVSPSLKAHGIGGRARLFEVLEKVSTVNAGRRYKLHGGKFCGRSVFAHELSADGTLELDFITAPPQMKKYMDISGKIYKIYLRYIAPEDIHVYSVDEVFIDATAYLGTYRMTAHELAVKMIRDVLKETGITATAGIGTNLYLAKVAMDIVAKKMPADRDGVRIAELDEMSYRRMLWTHTPITDFWRVGRGIAKRLEEKYIFTMGDIAEMSVYNEDLLYGMFGVNAELLIDHAWGWEPCTISDIKAYRPQSSSISRGQVLSEPYSYEKGLLIVREMAELLALDLVEKHIVSDQVVLTVGYDILSAKGYSGAVVSDMYGRAVPKSAHGSGNLGRQTSSARLITDAVSELYRRIVDNSLLVRRMYVVANHTAPEDSVQDEDKGFEQLDFYTDYEAVSERRREEEEKLRREHRMQSAMLDIMKKYGKNAVLRGMNLEEGAKTIERNGQVGGHKA